MTPWPPCYNREDWQRFSTNIFATHNAVAQMCLPVNIILNKVTTLCCLVWLRQSVKQEVQSWSAAAHFSGVNTPTKQFQAARLWNWKRCTVTYHHVVFLPHTQVPKPSFPDCVARLTWVAPTDSSLRLLYLGLSTLFPHGESTDFIKMTKWTVFVYCSVK